MTSNVIRRVVSECEDMMVDNSNAAQSNINFPNNDVINSSFTTFPSSRNNESFFDDVAPAPNGEAIDVSFCSHGYDAMEGQDAPITLIESTMEEDQYLDNSSLSCDYSDVSDPNMNMLLFHERHGVPPLSLVPPLPTNRADQNFCRTDSNSSSGRSSQRAPSSQNSDWGFFEDVHQSSDGKKSSSFRARKNLRQPAIVNADTVNLTSTSAVTAPNYVLEDSPSTQFLWKQSAGQRPPQPSEERAFFEKMWAQNFARSQVDYRMPVEVLTATSPISLDPYADGNFVGSSDYQCYANTAPQDAGLGATDIAEAALVNRMSVYPITVVNKTVKDSSGEGDLTVLVRGDNVFGTTVSKSFARTSEMGGPISVDTVNISIASYRVVTSKKHGKYAQFLVIYREGNILDTVGIWKRYRDFEVLANKVTQSHEGCALAFASISPLAITQESETEHLPNAITSWRLLKKRKRWYRCLDAGYLSLKVFLLERFLHDILFESSSPHLLREFIGIESGMF